MPHQMYADVRNVCNVICQRAAIQPLLEYATALHQRARQHWDITAAAAGSASNPSPDVLAAAPAVSHVLCPPAVADAIPVGNPAARGADIAGAGAGASADAGAGAGAGAVAGAGAGAGAGRGAVGNARADGTHVVAGGPDGGGGGGGGKGGAANYAAAAPAPAFASASATIPPEPNSAHAATYTVTRAATTSKWVANTDAAARRAVAFETHSEEAVTAAAESAAAARPLEVELVQVRNDHLRDELQGSKGMLKAYNVRTYTAEEQLAERAEVILKLNAKADGLAASIANIKQECNRKVDSVEYAAANRVTTAEEYAANRIETALLRVKAEASVSEAKLRRRLVDEAEHSQAEALRNLRFQLNNEHRAEVERMEQSLGRQMGEAVHEFHQNTRNMQRKMKSAEERCAKEVESARRQARLDSTQAAERAIAQERGRPGGLKSPSRNRSPPRSSALPVHNSGPSERAVLNDMQQRLRDLETTVTVVPKSAIAVSVVDDYAKGSAAGPSVRDERYQCGSCNRQYSSMASAMQCRYARVSGGCHNNPAGFRGKVGPSSVSEYLNSDLPSQRNDNQTKIKRLNEIADLSASAAGRDGIIRHSAHELGSQRWYKPPRTQAAPMYISRHADSVGAIPT